MINELFISAITGLSLVGHNFFKERKSNEDAMDRFFKDEE